MKHLITREIGIDMAHRVTHHGSKCRSLHGHRYTIQAICEGTLFNVGEQQGMVLDFGFLKEEMMQSIDALCDHGAVLWQADELVQRIYPETVGHTGIVHEIAGFNERIRFRAYAANLCLAGKLVVLPFVPTAENLAYWWFYLLAPRIQKRSEGQATLHKLIVYETPNCKSEYSVH